MSAAQQPRRVNVELNAEYLTLTSPEGHVRVFRQGENLPDWAPRDVVDQLIQRSAATIYEVI